MSSRTKKWLIAAAALVPSLAFAGHQLAEKCFGWCPFCH
jgi:hypothetical protein